MSLELAAVSSESHVCIGQVERAVQTKTAGRIRGLRVHIDDGCLVVSGRTSTYYTKQLATHAVRDMDLDLSVQNDIEVA